LPAIVSDRLSRLFSDEHIGASAGATMTRVHLVVLWHMHQPQYRDPESGRYVLPWTRLHAIKDYWGMVKVLQEVPQFHATFNVVPSLGAQLEEYASGKFDEPWNALAFKKTENLTREDKVEILARAFQLNHDRLMARWPRFVELFEWSRPAGGAQALVAFTTRDWRDLQVLSQLAWMDEVWLAKDEAVSRLADKGKDFTERDKEALQAKLQDLLNLVLPTYRDASKAGQIELSTTPFYHPILPLLCDSDIARVANPGTPLPRRAYRQPEDVREQLRRARDYHERVFGAKPAGLWPSEGSVSDQALAIAAEEGFQWFGTDEGVLGRTLNGKGNYWALPRSPAFRFDWVRLQPHGSEIRRRRSPRKTSLPCGQREERGSADDLYFPGRRKRLGILPRQRSRIPPRVLPSHSRRSGFSGAHRQRSHRRRQQYSRDRRNFSRLVDQRQFRCVDRQRRGCGRVGTIVGRAAGLCQRRGGAQTRPRRRPDPARFAASV
jgi:hypothetical protein